MRIRRDYKNSKIYQYLSSFYRLPYQLEKAIEKAIEHIEIFYRIDGKDCVDSVIEYFNVYLQHYYKDEDYGDIFGGVN